MKKVFSFLAIAAALCLVGCKKGDTPTPSGGGETPSGGGQEPAKYEKPITIDGQFADWAKLDGTKIATATTDPEANHTALKVVKVYADANFVFVYFEWDKEQIEWELDVEHVPFHVYINGDGKATTGGFGDQWSDACTDVMFEGFLTDGEKIASYEPGVFKWVGETNGTGWTDCWEDLGAIDGICSGAGVEGKYELQIVRELYPFKPLADNFSIGFDIQQGWNSVGVLPNTAVTDDNPGGLAPSLQVTTVK